MILRIVFFLLCLYQIGISQSLDKEFIFAGTSGQALRDAYFLNDSIYFALVDKNNDIGIKYWTYSGSIEVQHNFNFVPQHYSVVHGRDLIPIPREDFFYIIGNRVQSGISRDYILKVDTTGIPALDTSFGYFAYHSTCEAGMVLHDKSLVTTGYIDSTGTDRNLFVRRIDSLGSRLWEKTYRHPGNQIGTSVEMSFDGSLLIGVGGDDSSGFARLNLDGDLLQYELTAQQPGYIPDSYVSFDSLGNVRLTGVRFQGGGFFSHYDSIGIISNFAFPNSPTVDAITTRDFLTNTITNINGDIQLVGKSVANGQDQWSYVLSSDPNDGRAPFKIEMNGTRTITCGYTFGSLQNDEQWAAIVNCPSPVWDPDPCTFSPPLAGFSWFYAGGLLSCTDTSFSGMIYHDSIYDYQWIGDNGFSSDSSTFFAIWDTSINDEYTVSLAIENFYQCRDTVTVTLKKYIGSIGSGVDDELMVSLYPNPVRDVLQVQFESGSSDGRISLRNVNGMEVYSAGLQESMTTLNLSELAPGVYVAIIEANGRRYFHKLVKD